MPICSGGIQCHEYCEHFKPKNATRRLPNTKALKSGEIRSASVALDFADVKVPNTAFKDVVRNLKYDVAELAIVTFLQAKAHGKPLALLPAVVVGSLPHPFLVYNAERGRISPAELNGKRVGIRAYSVTTAAWIRGVLQNDHGVDLDSIHWVTFEDPHVAEYSDPPTAVRAPAGESIVEMLIDGEIDAGVVGGPDLKDSRLQPVIADPHNAALNWYQKHGALPINHMLVVKESLAKANPAVVREVFRLVRESKLAMASAGAAFDPCQFGLANIRRSLELIIDYSTQQGLIPKQIAVDDLFDDVTRRLD
jgi:4,5-dihydroxyphthalate decarboxylase